MSRTSSNIPGVHEVRTMGSSGRRSIPFSVKSSFLDLYVHENKKERLKKEKERIEKDEARINAELAAIDKKLAALLKVAAGPLRNPERPENGASSKIARSKKKRVTLGY